jgi:hypothetical protein
MRKIVLTAAALLLAAGAAQAQGRFIHPADKNHDQKIDRAEWVAAGFPAAEFAKADANKDGGVNGPEFVDWNTKQAGGPGR